jgi:hypothetical protein
VFFAHNLQGIWWAEKIAHPTWLIFAGNMYSGIRRSSSGTDVIKFYKFSRGKFVLLKTLPYGRAR